MSRSLKRAMLFGAWALIASGCDFGGGDDDEDSASTSATATETDVTSGSTTENTASVAEANPLTTAYPGGLAISVFPQSSTSLALGTEADNLDKKTAEQKVDDANKRLIGEGDCFSKSGIEARAGFTAPTCYEFDSDMMPFKKANDPSGNSVDYGTTDGTDGKGEACMVAFARSQMTQVVNRLEHAMFMVEAMMCQAKKAAEADGATLELPAAAGESLDLSSALSTATDGKGMTITKAKIDRKADIDGRPVYHNLIEFKDFNGETRTINLVHSPAADGSNATYNGTLWVIRSGGSASTPTSGGGTVQQPGTQTLPPVSLQSTTTKKRYFHVNYAKSTVNGEPRIRAEMRRANVKEDLNPITAKGELDFNVGASFTGDSTSAGYGGYGSTQSNDIIEGMKLISFDMNPDTGVGRMAYWVNPGGNYYENARGFLFDLNLDSSGVAKGCGVTGAAHYLGTPTGISIRRALKEGGEITLKPRGYYHPFATQNATTRTQDTRQPGQHGTTITKQCFKQNATSFLYEIDTSLTTSSQGYDIVETGVAGIEPPTVTDAKPLGEVAK